MSTTQPEWFKSTYSAQNGECVEALRAEKGMDLRDSNAPDGPVLSFPASAWAAFVAGVKTGGFDD